MYNRYTCMNCGCAINVDEGTRECVCESCESKFTIAFLLEREQKIAALQERVKSMVHADEENKRKREESDAKRYADANENKTKKEQVEIARIEAETRKANAEAANAGKPKTVIMNGPNSAMLGENAIKAFVAKDFQNAFKAAEDVLAIDKDNLCANFIKVYKDYVVGKRQVAINNFMAMLSKESFYVTDADLEALEQLFATTPVRLRDYEKQILAFVYANSFGDPAKEASTCKFVDSFCPEIIMSRSDHTFFTPEMKTLYGNFAEYCTIPKTCHTLILSINSNPESPIKSGKVYLKSLSAKFYSEYVMPLESVILKMKSDKYRAQFSDAYSKFKAAYKQKAQI